MFWLPSNWSIKMWSLTYGQLIRYSRALIQNKQNKRVYEFQGENDCVSINLTLAIIRTLAWLCFWCNTSTSTKKSTGPCFLAISCSVLSSSHKEKYYSCLVSIFIFSWRLTARWRITPCVASSNIIRIWLASLFYLDMFNTLC